MLLYDLVTYLVRYPVGYSLHLMTKKSSMSWLVTPYFVNYLIFNNYIQRTEQQTSAKKWVEASNGDYIPQKHMLQLVE